MNPDKYGPNWEYDAGRNDARAEARESLAGLLNKLRADSLGDYASPAERNAYLTALAAVASGYGLTTETVVTYRA